MAEDEDNWKFYCDRVFAGRYSDYILDRFSREGTMMQIGPDDMRLGALPIDFYGLNVYNRIVVSSNQDTSRSGATGGNPSLRRTYYDRVIYDAVHLIRDLYHLTIPIYITENGLPHPGEEQPDPADGIIHDDYRVEYLRAMLANVEELLAEGQDIRGYFLWTLMDNLRVSRVQRKYGLLRTDFNNLERT